jgi:hypothetical protein
MHHRFDHGSPDISRMANLVRLNFFCDENDRKGKKSRQTLPVNYTSKIEEASRDIESSHQLLVNQPGKNQCMVTCSGCCFVVVITLLIT